VCEISIVIYFQFFDEIYILTDIFFDEIFTFMIREDIAWRVSTCYSTQHRKK